MGGGVSDCNLGTGGMGGLGDNGIGMGGIEDVSVGAPAFGGMGDASMVGRGDKSGNKKLAAIRKVVPAA